MADVNKDVHTEHCCAQHGCKYADPGCPVASGNKPQSYLCESCELEKEDAARHNVEIAKDAEIERLRAEREVLVAEAMKYAGKSGRLEAKVEQLADALCHLRNHTSVNSHQIELIDTALRDRDKEDEK